MFGSDTGAVSALVEDGGEVKAEIFAAPGVKLVLSPGNRPHRSRHRRARDRAGSAFAGEGRVLRFGVFAAGHVPRPGARRWTGRSTIWNGRTPAVLCAFGGDGEIYIDGLTGEMLPRSPD